VFIGLAVLLVGIILAIPFIPGPGIPLVILGLVLLSDHFAWARRSLHWVKEKWHHHVHRKREWPRGSAPNGRKDSSA
jgi:putative transmembrane protein PGPGW